MPVDKPDSTRRNAPWVYAAISAGKPFHFRRKNRWLHNATNLAVLTLTLGGIFLLLEASHVLSAWLYLLLAPLGFGLLYFVLFILVVHEASHGMFLLSANRTLERWLNRISGWAVCACFGVHYAKHWERGHVEHHVRPLEDNDPQRFSIWVGAALWGQVFKTLFIPGYLFYARTAGRTKTAKGKSSSSKHLLVMAALFWTTSITITTWVYGWAAGVAIFLGMHVLQSLNALKGGLEHGGAIGDEPNPFARSRTTLFVGRHLLMPLNITLHFEHHLNFTVPWYDLGRYHRELKSVVPPEVWNAVINHAPLAQLKDTLGGLSPQAREAFMPANVEQKMALASTANNAMTAT